MFLSSITKIALNSGAAHLRNAKLENCACVGCTTLAWRLWCSTALSWYKSDQKKGDKLLLILQEVLSSQGHVRRYPTIWSTWWQAMRHYNFPTHMLSSLSCNGKTFPFKFSLADWRNCRSRLRPIGAPSVPLLSSQLWTSLSMWKAPRQTNSHSLTGILIVRFGPYQHQRLSAWSVLFNAQIDG